MRPVDWNCHEIIKWPPIAWNPLWGVLHLGFIRRPLLYFQFALLLAKTFSCWPKTASRNCNWFDLPSLSYQKNLLQKRRFFPPLLPFWHCEWLWLQWGLRIGARDLGWGTGASVVSTEPSGGIGSVLMFVWRSGATSTTNFYCMQFGEYRMHKWTLTLGGDPRDEQ